MGAVVTKHIYSKEYNITDVTTLALYSSHHQPICNTFRQAIEI